MKITGDFEYALAVLLSDLEHGVKTNEDILITWDTLRGNDWFTQTRLDLADECDAIGCGDEDES